MEASITACVFVPSIVVEVVPSEFCVILVTGKSCFAFICLEAVQSTTDGFELAEKDLSLRGPGELLGTRQAGVAGLRVGDLFRDHEWLELTCKEARRLAAAEDDESVEYCQRIQRYWERRFAMTQTG